MELHTNDYQQYENARKQVRAIRGFYGSLFSYILFNAFFLFINLTYSPDHLWFFWPMLWWGIGLVFHGVRVFRVVPYFGKDWENRKIKEFMEQEKRQNNKFE